MAKFAILSQEQAVELADSIKRRGKALERDIQSLCVTAIAYANMHGDITIANRVMPSLPTGQRRQACVNLLEAFGKLRYNAKTKEFEYRQRDDVMTDAVVLIEELSKSENFWTVYTPEPTIVSSVDALVAVQRLVKSLTAAAKKGTTIENREILEKLVAMVEPQE